MMIGLGTLINTGAIIVAGILGLVFGKALPDRFQKILISACGLATIFIAIGGCLEKMFTVSDGKISSGGTIMMLISLALGSLIGEFFRIEDRLESFGNWLKKKTKSEKDGGFVNAFVTASLTVCVGAMAIVGAIQDGIFGDYTTLAAKAILDFIIIIIMSSSMGKGAVFSAIPVFILQGGVTLLAHFIEPLMTTQALANISYVGSMLIFCVGVNLIWEKKFSVANMLPSIIIAVIWAFLPFGQ